MIEGGREGSWARKVEGGGGNKKWLGNERLRVLSPEWPRESKAMTGSQRQRDD